jgi:hypothetical protein
MKTIDLALQDVTGYLISITRNTKNGWYELEMGIPKNWVYDETDEISCEILNESKTGKLVNVAPKNEDILIDDLITFLKIIILTNEKIAEKQLEFESKMQEMKVSLEAEARKFYKELDELRETSFTALNDETPENNKKPKRPYRKPTTHKPMTGSTS